MKKLVVAGIALFSVMAMTTSCKKCEECHYDGLDASGQEIEIEIGEQCGDDLEALEASGYVLNDSTTVDVHCHGH